MRNMYKLLRVDLLRVLNTFRVLVWIAISCRLVLDPMQPLMNGRDRLALI